MFNLSLDDRLSTWSQFRANLINDTDPLTTVCKFWQSAPYIPYNNKIDPYHPKSWPTPWEIIEHNRYDDFTKAVMIGWSLKYSNRYRNNTIQLQSLIDKDKKAQYNVICVDNEWVLNYTDNGPISIKNMPDSFYLENNIELEIPR